MPDIISVDGAAFDILFSRTFRGEVHSVFARAINFTDGCGNLYCLAAEELDDAPGTVRVSLPAACGMTGLGIRPGDSVASTGKELVVGNVIWRIGRERRWAAGLPPFPRRRRRLAASLAALRRLVAAEGAGGGMKAFVEGKMAGSLIEQGLAGRAAELVAALGAGNVGATRAAGFRLVGLGVGLTPSGDDFLAGVMLVFCMPNAGFGADFREMAAELAAGAETGAVGRALLKHAAAGRASAGVIALLAALAGQYEGGDEAAAPAAGLTGGGPEDEAGEAAAAGVTSVGGHGEGRAAGTAVAMGLPGAPGGGEEGVIAAARRVLAVGATSGTDMIAGLLTGLEAALELAIPGEEERYGCTGGNQEEHLFRFGDFDVGHQ